LLKIALVLSVLLILASPSIPRAAGSEAALSTHPFPSARGLNDVTSSGPGSNGTECAWYVVNNSYPGLSTYASLAGLESATVTINLNGVGGATYAYVVDAVALVCKVPAGVNDFQVYVNASASTLGSGANWILATLQGGLPEGYAGALNSNGAVWLPSVGAGSMPNNASRNPESTIACDSAGGGIHVPYNGWSGTNQVPQTWSYSLNTTGQWTDDQCTQGHAGPPGIMVTASAGTTEAFYFLSLGFTNVSKTGLSGSPSLTLAAVSNPWLSSLDVGPYSATVLVNSSVAITTVPICTDGACPPGAPISWSLTNHLGELNASIGSPVTFLAGPRAGQVTLFVNVTIDGKTLEGSTIITITISAPPPPGCCALGPSILPEVIAAIVVAVVVAITIILVLLRRGRIQTRQPSPSEGLSPPPPGPDEFM